MANKAKIPDYRIIKGSPDWADKCREFCRKAYRVAYVRPDKGITKDLFTKEVFSSPRIVQYFQNLCRDGDEHKIWLAVDDEQKLLGMVAAQRYPDYCDMKGFYVKPEFTGRGIGHSLYQKVLEFAGSQKIQADVIEWLDDTIEMYKHWGFKIDYSLGTLNYPIVEWPEKARQAYKAIYMVKPGH